MDAFVRRQSPGETTGLLKGATMVKIQSSGGYKTKIIRHQVDILLIKRKLLYVQ